MSDLMIFYDFLVVLSKRHFLAQKVLRRIKTLTRGEVFHYSIIISMLILLGMVLVKNSTLQRLVLCSFGL